MRRLGWLESFEGEIELLSEVYTILGNRRTEPVMFGRVEREAVFSHVTEEKFCNRGIDAPSQKWKAHSPPTVPSAPQRPQISASYTSKSDQFSSVILAFVRERIEQFHCGDLKKSANNHIETLKAILIPASNWSF